jgi:serine/threonine protein kinase
MPFSGSTARKLSRRVQRDRVSFRAHVFDNRPDLRKLLMGMLEKNPEERLTLREIIQHPWLSKRDVAKRRPSKTSRTLESALAMQDASLGTKSNRRRRRRSKQ